MDSIEVLKMAFDSAHNWYQGTVAGMTAEQANELPPGITHPISELMAHILHSEDGMLNMFVRGEQPIWERDGWDKKLGLPMMLGQQNEAARAFRCDPQPLEEYAQTVFANMDDYLSSLTPADLDREVDFTSIGLGKMPLGRFLLTMVLGNTFAHTGEISALKGLRGEKGYAF